MDQPQARRDPSTIHRPRPVQAPTSPSLSQPASSDDVGAAARAAVPCDAGCRPCRSYARSVAAGSAGSAAPRTPTSSSAVPRTPTSSSAAAGDAARRSPAISPSQSPGSTRDQGAAAPCDCPHGLCHHAQPWPINCICTGDTEAETAQAKRVCALGCRHIVARDPVTNAVTQSRPGVPKCINCAFCVEPHFIKTDETVRRYGSDTGWDDGAERPPPAIYFECLHGAPLPLPKFKLGCTFV